MTAAPTSTSEPWPPSIRRVAELDWHGCESGVVGSTLVILPLFAVLAVRFDLVAVIAGVFVASGQSFLLRVWAIDERSGGAHLRHVLGIPRRTVVRARYAVAALLTLTLTALSLACVALAGLVLRAPSMRPSSASSSAASASRSSRACSSPCASAGAQAGPSRRCWPPSRRPSR